MKRLAGDRGSQTFPSFGTLRGRVKAHISGPHLGVSDSVGLGGGPRIHISEGFGGAGG